MSQEKTYIISYKMSDEDYTSLIKQFTDFLESASISGGEKELLLVAYTKGIEIAKSWYEWSDGQIIPSTLPEGKIYLVALGKRVLQMREALPPPGDEISSKT